MAVTSAFGAPSTPAMNNPANPNRSLRSANTSYLTPGWTPYETPFDIPTGGNRPDPGTPHQLAPTNSGIQFGTGSSRIGNENTWARNWIAANRGNMPGQSWDQLWRAALDAGREQGVIGYRGSNVAMPQSPFGSLGDTAGMFTGQMRGANAQTRGDDRGQMWSDFLASGGGWRFDGNYGGQGGGSNPYGFDNAYRDTMANQNAVQALIAQSRQGLAPVMGQAQSMYSNPQGLDPAALQAQQRAGDMASASAMSAIQRDTRNALGAGGFGGSPAAAYTDAQIRGLSTQGDLNRRADISMLDAQTRNANRNMAAQWLTQLLGLDVQSAQGGADIIGRLQTPFLTPDAASAMGYGGGGTQTGGAAMPGGVYSSQQNNNQGSSRYRDMLLANQSPMPQQNTGGYRLGPGQAAPNYNAPSWLAPR